MTPFAWVAVLALILLIVGGLVLDIGRVFFIPGVGLFAIVFLAIWAIRRSRSPGPGPRA